MPVLAQGRSHRCHLRLVEHRHQGMHRGQMTDDHHHHRFQEQPFRILTGPPPANGRPGQRQFINQGEQEQQQRHLGYHEVVSVWMGFDTFIVRDSPLRLHRRGGIDL
jgi:hypothetical protein